MISLKSFYHYIIVESYRKHLWELRHFIREFSTNPGFRRNCLRNFRIKYNLYIVKYKINDLTMLLDVRDSGVGRPLYLGTGYEQAETTFIRREVKRGMVFVDVGANIGYYTLLASTLIGPEGMVLAFEPDPHNFDLLTRSVGINGLVNVRTFRAALGAEVGTATLYQSNVNYGGHALTQGAVASTVNRIKVDVYPFDELARRVGIARIDFVKIDVQGFESQVMNGMVEIMKASDQLTVLTEFWPHGIETSGTSPEDYFRFFTSQGMEPFLLKEDGSLNPIDYLGALDRIPRVGLNPEAFYINLVFKKHAIE
jgi:FkbM family methyltransferase